MARGSARQASLGLLATEAHRLLTGGIYFLEPSYLLGGGWEEGH